MLALIELLQAHGQMGGADLAKHLGVDRRTIRRYITALEYIGVPIVTEQGRYGGYRLVAGFKLPPMMFTDEETFAVSPHYLMPRRKDGYPTTFGGIQHSTFQPLSC